MAKPDRKKQALKKPAVSPKAKSAKAPSRPKAASKPAGKPSKVAAKTATKAAKATKPATKIQKTVPKPKISKTPAAKTPKPAKPTAKATAPAAKKAAAKPAPAPAPSSAFKKLLPKPLPVNNLPLRPAPAKLPEETSRKHLTREFLGQQKQRLIELRDHLLNQMQGVAQDTLRVRAEGSEASAFGMHQADAGSDAYDKDFALSLLSQEQDALYEIEEALKRIEGSNYGICEMSNKVIPKVRLEAIPHARFTVECQAQLERENKGRRRWDTIPQFMDSAEALVDEEDDASEEDDRRKEKD